MFAGKQRKSLI